MSSFAWPPERRSAIGRCLRRLALVEGVELVLPMAFADPVRATVDEIAEERHFWHDHGIEVVSVQSLVFGRPELQLFGDGAVRAELIDHLVRMAEVAAACGAARMVFGSPASRLRHGLSMPEAMKIATDLFRHLGERIAPLGVVVCVEPNPSIYAGCDFVNRIEEAVALVREVGHPAVRVQMDTGAIAQAMRDGSPPVPAAVLEAAHWSGHMHLSVPGLELLHSGDEEQAAIARMGAPWSGINWASIEMRTPKEADHCQLITEAVQAVSVWYPLGTNT
ncbi:MAG: TIM barrel protein [Flavobacteriales bacterium]|nr:TIM barrel protein [Flavobacteriales bacterium]